MELILNAIDYDENRPMDGFSSGGELYVVTDVFFPGEHWYDCVYLDLKTWLPNLISFGSNHTDTCFLNFMDGPYSIRLKRLSEGAVHADFIREQTVQAVSENIDLGMFLKSVLSCCRKYDRFLHENGKENLFQEEIKTLMKLLDT